MDLCKLQSDFMAPFLFCWRLATLHMQKHKIVSDYIYDIEKRLASW